MLSNKTYNIDSEQSSSTHKKRIWKNVVALTVAFTLNYSAYNGLFYIQSSLHRDEGVGVAGASVLYITSTVTCLFLSPLMIRIWGQKWTIFAAFITFFIWIAANGIGTWGSIMTASIINGLFTAPLWAAEGSYTMELAKVYAEMSHNTNVDRMSTLFFGIFSIHFGLSGLIGDSIAYFILLNAPSENFTVPSEEEIQENCGLNDCPWIEHNITYFDEPPKSVVWTLVGVYLVFCLIAILLVAFCVDSLQVATNQQQTKLSELSKAEICSSLLSCIKLMKSYRLWLLLPIDWYLATSYTFRVADFNGSWVTCALGIWMVGLVNIPGHVTRMAAAPSVGYISKKIGRVLPMVVSIIIGMISLLILAIWNVNGNDLWTYFMLTVLFALHISFLDTIVTAVHGLAFINDTAAIYACYNFFWGAFSAIPFGYSYYICSDVKLYITMAAFVVCFTCYFILEWDISRNPDIDNDAVESDYDFTMKESYQSIDYETGHDNIAYIF